MKINQRKDDGRWVATYYDNDGKRRFVYGKTRNEVYQKLRRKSVGQTIAQLLRVWLEANRSGWAEKTTTSYEQMARVNIIPHIGSIQADSLTPEDIEQMIAALQKKDLSNRTIEYAALILSRCLNWGIKRGKVSSNPVELVRLPRVEKYKVTPFTPEQAKKLLQEVKGHRLEILYRLGFALGLRRGELIALRWEDINFHARTLTIQQGKTNHAARTLPIPIRLVVALHHHQYRQQREKQTEPKWKENGLVFPSSVGTPLNPTNLRRHYKNVLAQAGLPDKRIHDIRHSCIAFLIAEGASLTVIKQIAGHSSASFTSDIYGHLLHNVDRRAIEGVESLLDD
jgi:integrase